MDSNWHNFDMVGDSVLAGSLSQPPIRKEKNGYLIK